MVLSDSSLGAETSALTCISAALSPAAATTAGMATNVNKSCSSDASCVEQVWKTQRDPNKVGVIEKCTLELAIAAAAEQR